MATSKGRRRTPVPWAAALALAIAGTAGAATEREDREARLEAMVATLEARVAELEAARRTPSNESFSDLAHWTRRVRLSGSASSGYFARDDLGPSQPDGFQVWDARLFIDAEILDDVALEDVTLAQGVGLSLEWDLVRIGSLRNDLGEAYVSFRGLGGSSWFNADVGRFMIPIGEAYRRYGRGAQDDPFLTQTVGPWWWDEGIRLHGSDADGRLGYVASISNGGTRFNESDHGGPQATLKIFGRPLPWLQLSVSGLVSDELGSSSNAASGALWLGETWARAFGAGSSLPNIVDGVAVADGPNELRGTWLVGADVVTTPSPDVRGWLGVGRYAIDSAGGGLYDRSLSYAIAELVLGGALLNPALSPFYLGVRTNLLTTGDKDRGYLLDSRQGSALGFNMESLVDHAVVLGLRLGRHLVLRAQYDFQQIELVQGATPEMKDAADDEHALSFAIGADF